MINKNFERMREANQTQQVFGNEMMNETSEDMKNTLASEMAYKL